MQGFFWTLIKPIRPQSQIIPLVACVHSAGTLVRKTNICDVSNVTNSATTCSQLHLTPGSFGPISTGGGNGSYARHLDRTCSYTGGIEMPLGAEGLTHRPGSRSMTPLLPRGYLLVLV